MKIIRIGIINQDPHSIEAIRQVIGTASGYEVVWAVGDGENALKLCSKDCPDLVLLDPMIAKLDGVKLTIAILKNHMCIVLVVTSSVTGNSGKVFDLLGAGALDAVCTPVKEPGGSIRGSDEFLGKLGRIGKLINPNQPKVTVSRIMRAIPKNTVHLLAIGSSTGGPPALNDVLSSLHPGLGIAVIVVQHVDEKFANGLAEWLQEKTLLKVSLAVENQRPEADHVYLAGTNDHLILGPDQCFHYIDEPKDIPFRPSVDVLFLSIERHWHQKGVAVLLTGMGKDGAFGLLALRKSGWHTICQDQKTSVVFGMPKAAQDLGAAVEILPILHISKAIENEIRKRGQIP